MMSTYRLVQQVARLITYAWSAAWSTSPQPAVRGFLTQYGSSINLSQVVSADEYPLIKAALSETDPHALHDVYPDPDSKIASFYCAECRHFYCTDHWKLWEVYEPDTRFFEEWTGEKHYLITRRGLEGAG